MHYRYVAQRTEATEAKRHEAIRTLAALTGVAEAVPEVPTGHHPELVALFGQEAQTQTLVAIVEKLAKTAKTKGTRHDDK